MKCCLLLLIGLILAASGEDEFSVFGMESPPEKGVFDPKGWLDPIKRAELEESYQGALDRWGVKVFVMILPEKPALGMEVFAWKIGRLWGGTSTWGVVLHVIGEVDSPWCVAERGENLKWSKEEEFDRVIESAMSRAHREPDQDLGVMVGARELTDELGFLGIISKRRDQMLGKAREDQQRKTGVQKTNQLYVRRALMVGLPVLLILSLALMSLLRSRSKKRMKSFEFPETSPRYRFGGPWSGGGNVLASFGGKESDEGSRRG